MLSKGKNNAFTVPKVEDSKLLRYYLGVTKIPTVIKSPLRRDSHPSFGLYTDDGIHIGYIDFATSEVGGTITLLKKYFNLNTEQLYQKIVRDLPKMRGDIKVKQQCFGDKNNQVKSSVKLSCHVRNWQQYDIDYWKSYGITLPWLKWCEVYPIDYKFIEKDGHVARYKADKYAYAFVERKEGSITYKFYQPFNKVGFKWQNSHDKSVLGLWTKIPESGDKVCICSSVKDALCLMENLKIPCICVQGEGYPISKTALKVLRSRFKDIYICLDCDKTGLIDAARDAEEYGFINVVIPQSIGGKDISDCYKVINDKEKFINLFKKLFKEAYDNYYNELPF